MPFFLQIFFCSLLCIWKSDQMEHLKWERQFRKLTTFVSLPRKSKSISPNRKLSFLIGLFTKLLLPRRAEGKVDQREKKKNEPWIAYCSHSSTLQKSHLWRENSQSAVPARSFLKARYSQGHNFSDFKNVFGTELQERGEDPRVASPPGCATPRTRSTLPALYQSS